MLTDADERPHRPSPEAGPHWEESWHFDFASADGRTAGYARLTVRPGDRTAWWWSVVVGEAVPAPMVLVRDHEVPPPKPGTLEIRGSGLWAEPVCETPFDHWSLGLEAFAVGLDDPVEAYQGERGHPIPLGFDLEWEAAEEPVEDGTRIGYRQRSTVHGDVLVGHERLVVAGTGDREHRWGPRDWWTAPATDEDSARLALDARGLIAPGAGLTPVYHAPIQVPSVDGRVSRLARALCRREPGGELVWVERLQPASSTTG